VHGKQQIMLLLPLLIWLYCAKWKLQLTIHSLLINRISLPSISTWEAKALALVYCQNTVDIEPYNLLALNRALIWEEVGDCEMIGISIDVLCLTRRAAATSKSTTNQRMKEAGTKPRWFGIAEAIWWRQDLTINPTEESNTLGTNTRR
jgi:hypothetical protein